MRNPLVLMVLTLVVGCATTPSASENAERVDLIIEHGTVIPMVGPNLSDGAVAVRDGAIVAVGPTAQIASAYTAADRIDARGMAVLPGFVNTHTHVPMTLFRGIADDRDLMDWLQQFIFPAEKNNVDREFVKWGTRLAAAEMIASGTTTFADMYYFEADIARETRTAGLRAVLGETLIDFPAPDNKTWDEAIAYSRAFAAEFKNDPLITAALAPHAPYTVSADHLKQVRSTATELGAPILIHVAETEDELRQVAERSGGMTPVAYLDSLGFLGPDVVAAHSVWLKDSEVQTLASRRAGVAHCPESNMMLSSGVAQVPELLRAGVNVGLGTDGPAGSNNNLDMIEEMASAARLQKVTRKDPKALSARQVLEMATIGGARVLRLDQKIGTLEPGKRADIIVINLAEPKTQPVYSVESAVVYAANGSDVMHTIVDGKVLMRDRRLLTLDTAEIARQAEVYRQKVLRSLSQAP
ncbi:amidohydrolase [Hyalangium sp.]|uniref:amidohydrolase n=1 Tax=Hyalangium sp. TaxID=2028555 RepID=UPI002D523CCB|nr:amidohydrolase [Hyalangium sp.]HYH96677.1 amidohydrolase [Hyalangium sp.]